MPKWKSVSLRQELLAEAEKAIKAGRYRSLAEFVSEAVRLRLEELRYTSEIPLEKTQRTNWRQNSFFTRHNIHGPK
ncbi:MAG: ribbon-helix-helix domain-containing protein [Candidatus Bathyarchaeia archaeon]